MVNTFIDPLTGKEEIVFTGVCRNCHNPLLISEVTRFNGNCENCWEYGNQHDLDCWNASQNEY
jgi:hypothetical protein